MTAAQIYAALLAYRMPREQVLAVMREVGEWQTEEWERNGEHGPDVISFSYEGTCIVDPFKNESGLG